MWLAYVIVEDGHEAHVAVVGTVSGQRGSPAGALGNSAVRSPGNARTVLPGGRRCDARAGKRKFKVSFQGMIRGIWYAAVLAALHIGTLNSFHKSRVLSLNIVNMIRFLVLMDVRDTSLLPGEMGRMGLKRVQTDPPCPSSGSESVVLPSLSPDSSDTSEELPQMTS